MELCREFVRVSYFDPCDCGSFKRNFCLRSREAYCEKCHPERASHNIKVYRNMYSDVVRVPKPNYEDIQTFRCNGRFVINIRPSKSLHVASTHTNSCPCGRGIAERASYCSIECLMNSTTTETQCRMTVCRMTVRRRKSIPHRSYVL
jgi:hypothetical protein